MKALQKHHEELNMQPLAEEEVEKLEELHSEVLAEYGQDFNRPHGWAHPDLTGYVSFKNIEKQAELDHFRPIYKWASDQVYSDTKGAIYSLSTTPTDEFAVTAGPSNTGFTDPAQYTALSLREVTDALLQLDFKPVHHLFSRAAGTVTYEIPRAFHEVQQQIEREEAETITQAIVDDIMGNK